MGVAGVAASPIFIKSPFLDLITRDIEQLLCRGGICLIEGGPLTFVPDHGWWCGRIFRSHYFFDVTIKLEQYYEFPAASFQAVWICYKYNEVFLWRERFSLLLCCSCSCHQVMAGTAPNNDSILSNQESFLFSCSRNTCFTSEFTLFWLIPSSY